MDKMKSLNKIDIISAFIGFVARKVKNMIFRFKPLK
jgi:hypothetical protein